MSTEQNKARVRRVIEDAVNKGDASVIHDLFGTDFVAHTALGDRSGPEAFQRIVSTVRGAYPDYHATIEDMMAEGDKVMLRYSWTGTFTGRYGDVEPKGRRTQRSAVQFYRFSDRKCVEWNAGFIGVQMVERNKAIARRIVDELWNKGNLEVMSDVYAPDFVFHGSDGQDIKGPDNFKQFVSSFLAAFPDHHMTVDDMVAEGDTIACRVTSVGTHKGSLMGIAPTGRAIKFSGIVIVRFENGKAVEEWEAANQLALLQQLGLAPAAQ